MADPSKRVPENVEGDFFVDSTCIDCDACRQIAPSVFAEAATTSYVRSQPYTAEDRRAAVHALLSCPTGSIGTLGDDDPKSRMADFPLLVEEPVYYCGFNSSKSYGGNSYFLRRESGNWLIDSPKFLGPLAKRLEELGGVSTIFLPHRDDVADARLYAEHFGARRVIHRLELDSQPDAEIILEGFAPSDPEPGMIAIPTPGHTAGHCCLLVDDRFLFTGDHLFWDRDKSRLGASKDYCWDSWSDQAESMSRLAEHRFEWVLPGHGQRVKLLAEEMHRQMQSLVKAHAIMIRDSVTRGVMLIRRDVLDRIATGEVSLAFRQWKRPTVRAGGTLRTAVGVLAIEAVDPITDDDVSRRDAQRAGFASREALLDQLCRHRGDQLYRISLRLAGADPRIALRENSRLPPGDVVALKAKLERLDQSSRVGEWTRTVLQAIAAAPGMKAGDLAAMAGFEKGWLKTNIRKLKELGLTESLSPGYRLSPRGRALLKRLTTS